MNWSFYRYRTNWHKHPWVTKFLCWMGRHDWELDRVISENQVQLKCFYCQQPKTSSISNGYVPHRWSGWPGAWCLDCGVENWDEICAAGEHAECRAYWEALLYSVGPNNVPPEKRCKLHSNQPGCPEPGSHRHDPYGREKS